MVSMLCADCGRWVKPGDWNPDFALCEVCSWRARAEGRMGRHENYWKQTMVGGR